MDKSLDEQKATHDAPEGEIDGLAFIRTSPGLSRTWELLRQRGEHNEAVRQAAALRRVSSGWVAPAPTSDLTAKRKTGGGNTQQAG